MPLLKRKFFPYPEYTELSFKQTSVKDYIRHLSFQDLPNIFLRFPAGDIERLDVGGASVVHSNTSLMYASPSLVSSEGNPVFYRDFVVDWDMSKADRQECACGDNKVCCEWCFTHVVKVKGKIFHDILSGEEFGNLVPNVDFHILFTGGRGLHIWITIPEVCAFNSTQRSDLLKILEARSGISIRPADRGVTTQSRNLIRMPFSLHDHTMFPVIPLFLVSSLSELKAFPSKFKNKKELDEYMTH